MVAGRGVGGHVRVSRVPAETDAAQAVLRAKLPEAPKGGQNTSARAAHLANSVCCAAMAPVREAVIDLGALAYNFATRGALRRGPPGDRGGQGRRVWPRGGGVREDAAEPRVRGLRGSLHRRDGGVARRRPRRARSSCWPAPTTPKRPSFLAARRAIPVLHHRRPGRMDGRMRRGGSGATLPVHVEVDTGMRRMGVGTRPRSSGFLDETRGTHPGLELAGRDDPLRAGGRGETSDRAAAQQQHFEAAMTARRVTAPVLRHLANSAALLAAPGLPLIGGRRAAGSHALWQPAGTASRQRGSDAAMTLEIPGGGAAEGGSRGERRVRGDVAGGRARLCRHPRIGVRRRTPGES